MFSKRDKAPVADGSFFKGEISVSLVYVYIHTSHSAKPDSLIDSKEMPLIMDRLKGVVKLDQRTILKPDSETKLYLKYKNTNEYMHHIRSIYIAFTWDLGNTTKYALSDEIEVSPKETKNLPPIVTKVPKGVGGNQGFRIGFETSKHSEGSKTDYTAAWYDTILRTDIADYNDYRSLFLISGSEGDSSTIRKLIHNWGFDIHEIYREEKIINTFKENKKTPTAVFGLVFPNENGDLDRQLLRTAASTALSHNVYVIIFKHIDANLPDLPPGCIPIEFEVDECVQLEKKVGPVLHGIRLSEESGYSNEHIEWVQAKIKDLPKELAEDALYSKIRNIFLLVTGVSTQKIKNIALDRYRDESNKIEFLDFERMNEDDAGVEKIYFIAREDIDMSGWRMETDYISEPYEFRGVSLSRGEVQKITTEDKEDTFHWLGFLDYREEDEIIIYDENNQIVLRESTPPTGLEKNSHIGIIHVTRTNGDPVKGEPITISDLMGEIERNVKTGSDGTYTFGFKTGPTDVLDREITVRGQTKSLYIERGVNEVEFTIL